MIQSYTVWVGGVEVNDYSLPLENAIRLANVYIDKGYNDVIIQDQRGLAHVQEE